jgi:ABC-type branched-subunit amino acid transport system substrate-binding protein
MRFHPSTGYIVNDWGLPGIGLANAYDAANLEIDALVKALQEGKGGSMATPREAVRANIQSSRFTGLAGTLRFDRNGDTTDKVIGIWHVTSTTGTSFGWLGYAPGYRPRTS